MQARIGSIIKRISRISYVLGSVCLLAGLILAYVNIPASAANLDSQAEMIATECITETPRPTFEGTKTITPMWTKTPRAEFTIVPSSTPKCWVCTATPEQETPTSTPTVELPTPTQTIIAVKPTETTVITDIPGPSETPEPTATGTLPTQTPTETGPLPTETPTETSPPGVTVVPPLSSPTPTEAVRTPPATLSPPTPPPGVESTPAIIPITGFDLAFSTSQSFFSQNQLLNLGIGLLGLGMVFHGISRKFN
jgi:hypothetical protein